MFTEKKWNTFIKKKVCFSNIELYKNGKNLTQFPKKRCFSQNLPIAQFPRQNPNKENNDCEDLLNKGIQSLENPVLRGSFILILTNEQMNFYDEIAKKAFCEVMALKPRQVTSQSFRLYTHHLTTDREGIQNKRPGVYIIMNVKNRKCIVGQTLNLKKRFNQYTSRGKKMSEQNKINKNFFLAVQKELENDLE